MTFASPFGEAFPLSRLTGTDFLCKICCGASGGNDEWNRASDGWPYRSRPAIGKVLFTLRTGAPRAVVCHKKDTSSVLSHK